MYTSAVGSKRIYYRCIMYKYYYFTILVITIVWKVSSIGRIVQISRVIRVNNLAEH